jgi:NAD+ synthetase
MPVLDTKALIDNRVKAIQDYHKSINVPRAQIDVSGGVDSAVIVGLLALALGPDNITAVHSGINSNPEHYQRAQEVCDVFGVKLLYIDLTPIYENLVDTMLQSIHDAYRAENPIILTQLHNMAMADPTILGSIRSTLRAPVGRGFNRMTGGGIRHGTGNECEDRWTRFYQKGGDGEVDTNPIAMLSKGEVFQLALALGVPKSIIKAKPSPDLWGKGDQHNDEDEYARYFGFNPSEEGQTFYSYIDVETGGYTKVGLIERVSRFLDDNEYGETLFLDRSEGIIRRCLNATGGHPAFEGVPNDLVEKTLAAAIHIERVTRHKMNPNCPALGNRAELVQAEILTNNLPKV